MAFRVFKRKASSYQTWQEEENEGYRCTDSLIEADTDAYNTPMSSVNEETDGSFTTYGSVAGDERMLLECFYLGSFNMSGRVVTGRGCIDEPAAQIWQHTQEECKAKGRIGRKNSSSNLPLEFIECKPKYIRLVAGKDHLKVVDQYSEQTLLTFSHRCISFTGTHPKYSKMFCFIAWEPKNKTPYCHAFKCEDGLAAKACALKLSDIFKRKSKELMTQSSIHSSSPRHVLRKTQFTQSLQIC